MKKLKLELDELKVETFDTTPVPGELGEGTVFGFNSGSTCAQTCPDTCDDTCGRCATLMGPICVTGETCVVLCDPVELPGPFF